MSVLGCKVIVLTLDTTLVIIHRECPSNYPCVPCPCKVTPEILGIRRSSWPFRMPTMAHSDSDAIVCVPCLRQAWEPKRYITFVGYQSINLYLV